MNKKSIIIGTLIIIIILAISIGGTYYFYTDAKGTDNKPSSMNENENFLIEENNVIENNTNENITEEENNINNTTQNNLKNEANNKNDNIVQNTTTENTNSELESISDEEKAIEIVKKDWGSTDGVDFKIQTTDANGNYVVAVYNPDTSAVLAWYTVNPKTGTFTN